MTQVIKKQIQQTNATNKMFLFNFVLNLIFLVFYVLSKQFQYILMRILIFLIKYYKKKLCKYVHRLL